MITDVISTKPYPIKLYIQGIAGRVGSIIHQTALTDKTWNVINSPDLEEDCNLEQITLADAIIDFSSYTGLDNLSNVVDKAIVIGTTGAPDQDLYEAKIKNLATKNKVFYSPNMSLGVCLIKQLVNTCHQFYQDLGIDTSAMVLDVHHAQKRDAPSGTALLLGKDIDNVQYSSIRFGKEVGIHEIWFDNTDERIELKHQAKSIGIFVPIALKAALLLIDQPVGLYTMQDMINLLRRK